MATEKQLRAARENGKKGGRPKGYAALQAEIQRAYVAEQLSKHMSPIVRRAIKDAKNGDKHARDWLSEFAFGKPSQPLTGANGDPLFTPKQSDRDMAAKVLQDMFIWDKPKIRAKA